MPYNLAEAGAAIGRSKSSVLRAIRRGAISAARDEATGNWAIDPAELHRVFPLVAPSFSERKNGTIRNGSETAVETAEMRELRARLDDAHRTIEDLRQRLDRESEERREAQRQLAALLTDQRAPTMPTPRKRWLTWRRR